MSRRRPYDWAKDEGRHRTCQAGRPVVLESWPCPKSAAGWYHIDDGSECGHGPALAAVGAEQ